MKIIDTVKDLIFPPHCPVCGNIVSDRGEQACIKCRKTLTYVTDPYCIKCGKQLKDPENMLCRGCMSRTFYFDEGRAAFLYDDVMRKSIYSFKYGGRAEYAAFYAQEMYRVYHNVIDRWNPDVIVPVPVHKSKLKKRGYNQAFLIAKELSKLTGIPVNNGLLIRIKETEKQKELGASDRAYNLKNAFKMNPNGVKYLSCMLVDDIYTTGATMNSGAKALKEGGTGMVYCLSLSIGYDI